MRLSTALEPRDRRTLDDVARSHVKLVLAACHGNRTNAARMLGMDRKTLTRNMARWGIAAQPELKPLTPGSLVAIEGLDGSGITTQATRLQQHLTAHGHPAMLTQEPSKGPVGALIHSLIADAEAFTHAGAMRTLSLLFAADRVDHFHRVVAPALARGITVVSDRWYHSSLAYQRTGVEREWIATLNRYTRTPDVTIFLEVPPELARQRRSAIRRPIGWFQDAQTQVEVAAGYRATIAELRADGERIEILDGTQDGNAVFAQVLKALGLRGRLSQP